MKTPNSISLKPVGCLVAGFLFFTLALQANEKPSATPSPFPGLSVLKIEEHQQLSYEVSLATVIQKPIDEQDTETTRLITTRLDKASESRYWIDFDPGPSADPVFLITDEKNGQLIGRIGADSLFVPGNGFIYAIGRSNNLHFERQKFAIREGELVEIKQPFSYVGLDTKAKADLTITFGKASGETIATIPKGDPLQVVIRDGDYLLIKTQFGLTGWWKINTEATAENTEIEGIYYAGD